MVVLSSNKVAAEELFCQKIYWLNQLSKELPETSLVADYVRPKSYTGKNKSISFQLPKVLSANISKTTNNSYLSIYLILLSTLSILVSKYTRNTDTIIGSPIYKLVKFNEDTNKIVPLRIDVNPELTFKDFLLQVKDTTITAYSQQNYPIDELFQLLNLSSSSNRHPITDIAICLENIHESECLADINNDLTFVFNVSGDEIFGRLDYNESLFNEAVVQYIIKYYINTLECVFKNFDIKLANISCLATDDKQHILEAFNNKVKQYPIKQTINELFDQQVNQTPNRIAVNDQNGQLTYDELNKKANQLARLLLSL